LSPPLGCHLFPIIAGIDLLGAAVQIVWLLVFGLNEERWREEAGAAAVSIWKMTPTP
jgi:hypothetical protein